MEIWHEGSDYYCNRCYRFGHGSDEHAAIALTRDEWKGWSSWYSVIAGNAERSRRQQAAGPGL